MKKTKQPKDMPQSHNSIDIVYTINSIQVLKSYMLEPDETISNDFKIENLQLGLKLDFSFDLEKSTFKILILPVYNYIFNENNLVLLEFAVVTEFEIKDLKDFIELSKDEAAFPKEMIYPLVSLAYSTTRGIIFAKTQGSFLNQLILPFINVVDFVDKKMEEIMNELQR